jgi:pimeloyl-ACP methyl ester carboxylesterase
LRQCEWRVSPSRPRNEAINCVSMSAPTLLIVGSEDDYKPHMAWLARELPHVALHVLANTGHFPFLEAPEAFQQAIASFVSPAAR